MGPLVTLLRPLVFPLLKLEEGPPHLPEGSSLVRALKPTEPWLAYRSLGVLFGLFNQLVGTAALAVALVVSGHRWGVAAAVALGLLELFVMAFWLVATRIDYELRHYLVGDRSLRVTQGAWKREEVTLSYANIQNLEVTQGPIERLFGFKSLTISTAGADASGTRDGGGHVVTLVGLADADELRRMMLTMLAHHRDTGLGDPSSAAPSAPLDLSRLEEVRVAAEALRAAARARAG